MATASNKPIAITDPAHVMVIGEWIGAVTVVDALKKQEKDRLPGFALALALAEKAEAEKRANNTARNLRAVAKADIDVTMVKQVSLIFKGDKPFLEVVMLDLADMAEGE